MVFLREWKQTMDRKWLSAAGIRAEKYFLYPCNFMLSHQYRLPATTKLNHPRFIRTSLFSVKYASSGLTISRFAFVIKKTADKRAVIRNRIRRVFRSCIEELLVEITPGYDMLFFLEKGIMEVTRDSLLIEIRKMLERNNIVTKA